MAGNFHIDAERLQEIVNAYAEYEPSVDTNDVEATLLYDWPEGDDHQNWLETADPQEIADWLAATTFDDLDD